MAWNGMAGSGSSSSRVRGVPCTGRQNEPMHGPNRNTYRLWRRHKPRHLGARLASHRIASPRRAGRTGGSTCNCRVSAAACVASPRLASPSALWTADTTTTLGCLGFVFHVIYEGCPCIWSKQTASALISRSVRGHVGLFFLGWRSISGLVSKQVPGSTTSLFAYARTTAFKQTTALDSNHPLD